MAKDISLWGATYSDVPHVDLPTPTNTWARFLEEGEFHHLYVSTSAPTSSDGEVGDFWIQVT